MLAGVYAGLGIVVVGLSCARDAKGTVQALGIIAGTVGTTWVMKKVVEKLNCDGSKFIEFAGWSVAGVYIVKILNLGVFKNFTMIVNGAESLFTKCDGLVDKISMMLDKIPFIN